MLMIEKVARAIAVEQGSVDYVSCLGVARAAVRALREPSCEMLEAALPNLPDWGYLPEEWTKMIDHVLQEEPCLPARTTLIEKYTEGKRPECY